MKASVIVPTYNGARKISHLLNALTKQTHRDLEVVVVIDGSTDNTESVIKDFQTKLPDLKIIAQANSGRSKTRNRGVAAATGELLIFYDDDMIPDQDSVERHIREHQRFQKPSVLCGHILEIQGEDKPDIQNYKAYLASKWTSRFQDGISTLTEENLFLTAANLSITKKLFLDLGGFDERLNDIEDREMGFRILKLGIPAFHDKSNVAVHNETISCKSYIDRVRQYTHAQDKLKQLIPELPNRPNTSLLKKFILFFFSFGFWVNLIDGQKLVSIPRALRYKIYEWVIFARGVLFTSHK